MDRKLTDTWNVAPHVGAWIEIMSVQNNNGEINVAPHVGAWIEMMPLQKQGPTIRSLLM